MPPDPEPGSAWHEAASLRGQCAGPHDPDAELRPTFDKSPVRESRTPGSVGEALSNQRLYPTRLLPASRRLIEHGITSYVLEPTSILVNRRARRAKTDRLDAEGMLRVLMAYLRGDRKACSMVRVPTPDEEDAKRPHREREHLVRERLRIENRIEALLFTQGIRERPSLRSWERDLAALRTGDGREMPRQLKAELDRLRRQLVFTLE